MNTPVVDFVRRYAQQRTTRMHMPGHKGRGPLGCEELDITEIAGADELYEAEGIIAQSEANATQLFGTARTYYSTEGSSQCIRAMLHLALQMRPAKAGRPVLLAARNAHKALLYAAALLDFDIQWLWPAPDAAGTLCTCPVEPEALTSALDELSAEGRTPFGVYLTSPDYLGFVQDVAGLSAVCHAHGLPLLVDNAHGAYLHFLKEGSRHPIQLGADLCCDSAHKTLPVLTGGAYLHLGPSVQADEAAVRNALALFGSTSPSYLILQSLDAANAVLADSFREKLDICRWLLGDEYEDVQCVKVRQSSNSNKGYDNPQVMLMRTKNGCFIDVEVQVADGYGYDIQCEVVCENGTVKLPDPYAVVRRSRPAGWDSVQPAESMPIMTDWKERFIEAYDIEFCKWVESVHAGKLTGPSSWDGYVACVAGDALNASRGTSQFMKVETMEKPEMYK